jgi:ABC-2 type transport system ATP-binding protein
MISIEKMYLNINGKEILKGIELHLQLGDIYGLIGPNGAGKSTTIFALLGLYGRSRGRIRVLDLDPKDHGLDIRRNIGVMPEQAGFYDWMAASEYLRWYGDLYGQRQSYRDLRELISMVGLGSVGFRRIGTYSRGMKQRLALARALVSHPKLLILDEPTNGLDPKGRREIHDVLLDFSARRKGGVLLCTHLLDDVDRLCNRIGILDHGRTQLEGLLADLLTRQGTGMRYRLRLENTPDTANLPAGLSLLPGKAGWWRVELQPGIPGGPSTRWEELWRRGWRILEIHSEVSSLEDLYLSITGRDQHRAKEVTT